MQIYWKTQISLVTNPNIMTYRNIIAGLKMLKAPLGSNHDAVSCHQDTCQHHAWDRCCSYLKGRCPLNNVNTYNARPLRYAGKST